jgi:hypothetical protein
MQTFNSVQIQYLRKADLFGVIATSGFENRTVKTARLVNEAFERVHTMLPGDIDAEIYCHDFYDGSERVLAYCKKDSDENIITVPDFIFINWRETGLYDYDDTVIDIASAGQAEPIYDKLFWIGALSHPTRKTLMEISEKDPRIEAISMDWKRQLGKEVTVKDATTYVSLKDHTKYKYLIDIQGNGYSGRVKMLLFSGRPLFLVERPLKEWYYDGLKAYEHYIPVKEDLSDLESQLDWAESHEKEAKMIALNAQKFAIENLMHENAVQRMANVLLKLSYESVGQELEI